MTVYIESKRLVGVDTLYSFTKSYMCAYYGVQKYSKMHACYLKHGFNAVPLGLESTSQRTRCKTVINLAILKGCETPFLVGIL